MKQILFAQNCLIFDVDSVASNESFKTLKLSNLYIIFLFYPNLIIFWLKYKYKNVRLQKLYYRRQGQSISYHQFSAKILIISTDRIVRIFYNWWLVFVLTTYKCKPKCPNFIYKVHSFANRTKIWNIFLHFVFVFLMIMVPFGDI